MYSTHESTDKVKLAAVIFPPTVRVHKRFNILVSQQTEEYIHSLQCYVRLSQPVKAEGHNTCWVTGLSYHTLFAVLPQISVHTVLFICYQISVHHQPFTKYECVLLYACSLLLPRVSKAADSHDTNTHRQEVKYSQRDPTTWFCPGATSLTLNLQEGRKSVIFSCHCHITQSSKPTEHHLLSIKRQTHKVCYWLLNIAEQLVA